METASFVGCLLVWHTHNYVLLADLQSHHMICGGVSVGRKLTISYLSQRRASRLSFAASRRLPIFNPALLAIDNHTTLLESQ